METIKLRIRVRTTSPITVFLLLGGFGLLVLAAGLIIDSAIHAANASLTAHERIFSFDNPGHLILAMGLTFTSAGLVGAMGTMLNNYVLRLALAAGALAIYGGAAALIAWAPAEGDATKAIAEGANHDMSRHGLAGSSARFPDVAAATKEQRTKARRLLEESLASTLQYRDPERAKRDGYRLNLDEAGIYAHANNPHYNRDGMVLNPSKPESLVYLKGPHGSLTLVGVLYQTDGQPGPEIGGPITRWHFHDNCIDAVTRKRIGPAQGEACPDGSFFRRTNEMMHVWFT